MTSKQLATERRERARVTQVAADRFDARAAQILCDNARELEKTAAPPFEIGSDRFPHLSRAPIAEAVLEIRARAQSNWEEQIVRDTLTRRLAEYPHVLQRRRIQQQLMVHATKAEHEVSDAGWIGLELRSANNKQVAQFDRDRFSFARLRPYQRWEKFESEALRLWHIHCGIAQPSEIQRIGVRFINNIPTKPGASDVAEYMIGGPHQPRGMNAQSAGFFHHDIIAMPGSEYKANVIMTVQRPENAQTGPVLILDIDVFTAEPSAVDETLLKRKLMEMRWLKNKIFFGTITPTTEELSK